MSHVLLSLEKGTPVNLRAQALQTVLFSNILHRPTADEFEILKVLIDTGFLVPQDPPGSERSFLVPSLLN